MADEKPEWMDEDESIGDVLLDTTEEAEPETPETNSDKHKRVSNVKLKEVEYCKAKPIEVCTVAKFLKKARPKQYGDLFGEEDDAKGISRLLELSTNNILLIAKRHGSVLGAMGLWISEWDWGKRVSLDTDFLVCLRAWEQRGLGRGLIELAEEIADAYNLPMNLTVHSRVKPEPKSRYFENRGYMYLGSHYVRKPNGPVKQPTNDDAAEHEQE